MARHLRPPATLVLALLFALGAMLVGCGAKTGLDVPDAEMDAAVLNEIPCVEIPFDGGPVEVPLSTEVQLARADVVFLVDTTASMLDEIDAIREQLRDRLAPAIETEIPDSNLAVATFADFPIDPYGSMDDIPFELVQPMTDDLSRVQAAMNSVELSNGQDEPEAQVEALYQVATGEGFSPWVPASFGCARGGVGYPCFRDGALPIVLLFTDAPMHNGPGGSEPYDFVDPMRGHTFDEAIEALTTLDARVIGFDSGDGAGRNNLEVLARDTGTLDTDGEPLVYDIGVTGDGLGDGVVEAMKVFADSVFFDIDAILGDPDLTDGTDPRQFVDRLIPLRATPMDQIEGIDEEAGVFRGVKSGTTVVFQLLVRNDAVVPGPEPQRFLLEVTFRGDGRTSLGRKTVEIVIPGADGRGCDDEADASVPVP